MSPVSGFGPAWLPQGGVRFRLHAPAAARVLLRLSGRSGGKAPPRPMERSTDGWHWLDCPACEPGDRYLFDIGGQLVPDPASRFQPEGVHGPSALVDLQAYAWRQAWRGRAWHEAVIQELHVGSFTPEGSYDAVRERLDELARLGFTAIELMPLAQFAGRRGWGYDGVLPFAPHQAYGEPAALQALVDAAHERGLMVLLDVVYNHFGPEGHYLPQYWPRLVNADVHTPWGPAINYDAEGSAEVRAFVFENASYWLREFRFDGLRLDAVHAIRDRSERPLLRELAERLRREFAGRELHLVLENEKNDPSLLERTPEGPSWYTAQWNDDVHHGLHVALTGESEGYYADYHGRPDLLPRALAEGFAYQGEVMKAHGGPRGAPSAGLPWSAFVDFLQNHDQIGNRAGGERLSRLADPDAERAALAVLLLGPHVPLLFMGEQWGTRRPFLYFCDFDEPLASAVREGRRREFAHFAAFARDAAREHIPDPLAPETFAASTLDWAEAGSPDGRARAEFVAHLLRLRREQLFPWLADAAAAGGQADWRRVGPAFQVRWRSCGRTLMLRANLSAEAAGGLPPAGARSLFTLGEIHDDRLGAWSVCWSWDDG